jgi:hypothetical protein
MANAAERALPNDAHRIGPPVLMAIGRRAKVNSRPASDRRGGCEAVAGLGQT